MRVMVFMKATKESEAGQMPSEEMLAAMTRFNEELVESGILLAGEGLKPSSAGKRVRFGGGKKQVIDGPFAETKELVAGFWIWEVSSMEEAVEWVKKLGGVEAREEFEVEIRPIFEAEDFGEELTPELRAREDAMRAEIAKKQG